MKLSERSCVPCKGGVPPLDAEEIAQLQSEVKGWQVLDNKRLVKHFKFDDFKQAMDLADRVAVIAEEQGHHPDLLVRWGELKVEVWTHKIDGLTESDFILAARIDKCARV
jgi:4a-hydroxytetrahydrobiopterin dehydratase